MIRVLLVDDHPVVRTGIKMLLLDATNIEIVGEAGTGEEAIRLARDLKPEIVLMDVNMPGIGGLEATIRLLRNEPNSKILIISSHTGDFLPSRLMEVGAAGYLRKQASREQMIAAIQTIAAGNRYIDPAMMEQMVAQPTKEQASAPLPKLSERELQVLLMVAKGMTVDEIADKLFLSNKTVNGYRSSVLKKLRVKTDVEAARIAIEQGLVDIDSQQF